jgi:hypothetical protein
VRDAGAANAASRAGDENCFSHVWIKNLFWDSDNTEYTEKDLTYGIFVHESEPLRGLS